MGGVPVAIREFARELPGVHSLVCRSAWRAGRSWEFSKPGVDETDPNLTVIRVNTEGGKILDPQIEKIIKAGDYDVFLPHTLGPAILEGVLSVPKGKRIIVDGRYGTDKPIDKAVLNKVDLWMFYLECFKGEIKDAVILPIPYAASHFYPAPRGTKKLLYIGRIAPEKRVAEMVNALHSVGPEYALTILGDYDHPKRDKPPLQSALAGLKMPWKMALEFCPAKVGAILRAHDILLLPSRSETYSQVALQALACGRPVVSAAQGPYLDWAKPYVNVVPLESFGEAVQQNWPDPPAVAHFSWGNLRKRYIEELKL